MKRKKRLPLIFVLSAVLTLTECGGGGGNNVTQPPPPPAVTYSEQTIYNFGQLPDGKQPGANLVLDAQGNLYGTTMQGGAYGEGTVFKLSRTGGQWTETVLYNFCSAQGCTDGAQPDSGLIFDSAGNLFGTTLQGGAYGSALSGAGIGVVFELSSQQNGTWSETVLHSFGNGTDGKAPMGGVTVDGAGNLYGTTYQGGTGGSQCIVGCGTVFELTPGSGGQWTETILYEFCSQPGCTDGENPTSGITVDSAGNLFGTTTGGGLDQTLGLVFELAPVMAGQWTFTVLYDFQFSFDGYSPIGTLIQDKSGNLYGATEFGCGRLLPCFNDGTVFKLTRGAGNQWTETIVYALCAQGGCVDGSQPMPGIVFDRMGNIYGTTFAGGTSNSGNVFKLVLQMDGTWQQSTLYSFQSFGNGYSPAGVVLDSSGNIYGLAQGGANQNGMVFELAVH
jgi:uncharacterized repeat protein (TIGR03803 family)